MHEIQDTLNGPRDLLELLALEETHVSVWMAHAYVLKREACPGSGQWTAAANGLGFNTRVGHTYDLQSLHNGLVVVD